VSPGFGATHDPPCPNFSFHLSLIRIIFSKFEGEKRNYSAGTNHIPSSGCSREYCRLELYMIPV
jgi:hypothetical protein